MVHESDHGHPKNYLRVMESCWLILGYLGQGSLNYLYSENPTIQMYGNFERFTYKNALVWVGNIMTPVGVILRSYLGIIVNHYIDPY